MRYPAKFAASDGGYSVSFRDVPEAAAQCASLDEARSMAVSALLQALDLYATEARRVPEPSMPEAGEELIELPPHAAMRLELLNAIVGTQARLRTQSAIALGGGWRRAVPQQPIDTTTVFSFITREGMAGDIALAPYKATLAAIKEEGGQVLQGTGQDVPAQEVDDHGHYRRLATGWGEL
jgi:predicted RNase H-like HicB family nuclease